MVAHVAAEAAGGGDVAEAGVVHDHAVGAEAPGERADAVHHSLDPVPRQAIHFASAVSHLTTNEGYDAPGGGLTL